MKKRIDWQSVIDGYDPGKESVKDYCARVHISDSAYYTARKKLRASEIMPVKVAETDHTSVEINHIPIRYDTTVTDEELKRIIRLCNQL